VPLDVFVDNAIVGSVEVLHTTPFAVIDPSPSEVIVPPELAEIEVIEDMATVANVGGLAVVVKEISGPYAVAKLVLTYALI
jgi:hypothetical protein